MNLFIEGCRRISSARERVARWLTRSETVPVPLGHPVLAMGHPRQMDHRVDSVQRSVPDPVCPQVRQWHPAGSGGRQGSVHGPSAGAHPMAPCQEEGRDLPSDESVGSGYQDVHSVPIERNDLLKWMRMTAYARTGARARAGDQAATANSDVFSQRMGVARRMLPPTRSRT